MKPKTKQELAKMYDSFGDFLFGDFTWARKGWQWLHIDREGNPLYKERYEQVGPFCNGLAWARAGGKDFHIRTNGTRFEVFC